MASKITDYPAKTVFNNGDLYDVSTFDGATTYTSEKMTFTQLKANLNTLYNLDDALTSARTVTLTSVNTLTFDGGLTTFKGEDLLTTTFSIKALNSDSSVLMSFSNSGVFYTGLTDLSNYLRQDTQRTVQFSDNASITGFIADRNGGKFGLRSGSSVQYLQYTDDMAITDWDGSETSSGIIDTLMLFKGSSIYFGNNTGTGKDALRVFMSRLSKGITTVSAATQTDSAKLSFENGLWNGAASDVQHFDIQAEASSTTNEESILQLSHEGVNIFGVRNDGVAIITTFTVATLPSVIADGLITVSDETGGYTVAFSDGTNWRRVTDNAIVS